MLRRHRNTSRRAALDRAAARVRSWPAVGITARPECGWRSTRASFGQDCAGAVLATAMTLMCDPDLLGSPTSRPPRSTVTVARPRSQRLVLEREQGNPALAIPALIRLDLGAWSRGWRIGSVSCTPARWWKAPRPPTCSPRRRTLIRAACWIACLRPARSAAANRWVAFPAPCRASPWGYTGCAFRDRCAHAMPECSSDIPERERITDHRYLCRLPADWPKDVAA